MNQISRKHLALYDIQDIFGWYNGRCHGRVRCSVCGNQWSGDITKLIPPGQRQKSKERIAQERNMERKANGSHIGKDK